MIDGWIGSCGFILWRWKIDINGFILHENEANMIFILLYKSLKLPLFILITSRHLIFIMIIYVIYGHNPDIHPPYLQVLEECPHPPPWWTLASLTSITGSGSSTSRQTSTCFLLHLFLCFIVFMNGLNIFFFVTGHFFSYFFPYVSEFLQ